MKMEMTMCHSELLVMLLVPHRLYQAVHSYTSTSPDMRHEPQSERMLVDVVFDIKDIHEFIELWEYAQDLSKSPDWYHGVKQGIGE